MSAPDITRGVLSSFATPPSGGHLTILLGAGASAPSGLPMWNEFARNVATSSGLVAAPDAADLLLDRQDPTIVLEAAHAKTSNGAQWAALLADALYGDGPTTPSSSPLHYAAGHCLANEKNPAYAKNAIVTIARKGLSFSGDDFASVEAALIKEWESIGLTAPLLHDLSDAALVIRELLHMGTGNHRPTRADQDGVDAPQALAPKTPRGVFANSGSTVRDCPTRTPIDAPARPSGSPTRAGHWFGGRVHPLMTPILDG